MILRELTIAYRPTDPKVQAPRGKVETPAAAAAILVPLLRDQAQEVFVIVLLNTKRQIIAVHELSRGALTHVDVSPRLIIRAALLTDATGLILAHNHPSGDPAPSQEDIALTRRVRDCAQLFDIPVLDHLIVGDGRYTSLKEYGIL